MKELKIYCSTKYIHGNRQRVGLGFGITANDNTSHYGGTNNCSKLDLEIKAIYTALRQYKNKKGSIFTASEKAISVFNKCESFKYAKQIKLFKESDFELKLLRENNQNLKIAKELANSAAIESSTRSSRFWIVNNDKVDDIVINTTRPDDYLKFYLKD